MSKTTSLQPRLNEKTYALSTDRVFVFNIAKGTNKHDVIRAVETQFEVKVAKVNIANVKGKAKRTMSLNGKRYLNSNGSRSDMAKAYVTLQEGHSLPFFDAVEEAEEKQEALQEKVDKAAAKKAAKETKQTEKPARRGFHLPHRRADKRTEAK